MSYDHQNPSQPWNAEMQKLIFGHVSDEVQNEPEESKTGRASGSRAPKRGSPSKDDIFGFTSKKPKGPTTAYALFIKHRRSELRNSDPNASVIFTEFSRRCAQVWNNMTEVEKQPFRDLATHDKERHTEEMKYYVPTEAPDKKKKRQKKDPHAPKRALTSFFWYAQEMRPAIRTEYPELTFVEVGRELGRRWALLGKDQKARYQAMYEADKERYVEEMEVYLGPDHGSPPKNSSHIDIMVVPEPEQEEQDSSDSDDYNFM